MKEKEHADQLHMVLQ